MSTQPLFPADANVIYTPTQERGIVAGVNGDWRRFMPRAGGDAFDALVGELTDDSQDAVWEGRLTVASEDPTDGVLKLPEPTVAESTPQTIAESTPQTIAESTPQLESVQEILITAAAKYSAVPEELKQLSRWVTWSGDTKDKKPYISGTKKQASTTTPEHLVSFEQAIKNVQDGHGFPNLGFFPQQPFVGLDIDSCRNPLTGEIQRWAIVFLDKVGPTYTEITPSGGGLRAWVKLALDSKETIHIKEELGSVAGKTPQIEALVKNYGTISANVYNNAPSIVAEISEQRWKVINQWMMPFIADEEKAQADQSEAAGIIVKAPVDVDLVGAPIPHGAHDDTLYKVACSLRSRGFEEKQIADYLEQFCVNRCEAYGADYREMCRNKAKSACTHPAGSIKYSEQTDETALFAFKYPPVQGTHRDYVVSPAFGQKDGWFPLGAVSDIGGSSGSNKSTWGYDVLDKQERKENFEGHETYGRSYKVLMIDRGQDAYVRTMERLDYDPNKFPAVFLPAVVGSEALREIKNRIEENGPDAIPQIVFIEGADMLVEDANKGQFVVPFMSGLQRIAEHYHIAIILTVGAPKAKVGEGYVAKRDCLLGSEKWARMAETVVAMQFVKGDDMDVRRKCFVLLRNGPAEKFDLILQGGKLVKDNHPELLEKPELAKELQWIKDQATEDTSDSADPWWTCYDLQTGAGISRAQSYKYVQHALAKKYIVTKTGPKVAKGAAAQYRWNESESNPLWQESPTEDQVPQEVPF